LTNHAQGCYGGNMRKSMKAGELAISQKDCWRKIAITLIDRVVSVISVFVKHKPRARHSIQRKQVTRGSAQSPPEGLGVQHCHVPSNPRNGRESYRDIIK
jgi:hypothetical protein